MTAHGPVLAELDTSIGSTTVGHDLTIEGWKEDEDTTEPQEFWVAENWKPDHVFSPSGPALRRQMHSDGETQSNGKRVPKQPKDSASTITTIYDFRKTYFDWLAPMASPVCADVAFCVA